MAAYLGHIPPPHNTMMRQLLQAKAECGDSLLFSEWAIFMRSFWMMLWKWRNVESGFNLAGWGGKGETGPHVRRASTRRRRVYCQTGPHGPLGYHLRTDGRPRMPRGFKTAGGAHCTGTVIEPELLEDGRNNYLGLSRFLWLGGGVLWRI